MLMATATPRLVARHAPAVAGRSLLFPVRCTAIVPASPFSSLIRQSTTPPMTAIRFLAIKHTGNRVANQQRSGIVTRFSTSSSSTPASSSGTGNDGASAVTENSLSGFARLKDLWRKYGIVAIGTYLSMYGVVLGSIYVAIDQGWVSTKKPSRSENDGEDDEEFNLVAATNRYVLLHAAADVIGHILELLYAIAPADLNAIEIVAALVSIGS